MLNAEARVLAEAGAELLQIDEPFLAGYPEDVGMVVEAINIVTQGVDVTWGLHVCYGNRYARPSWEGHYDFLFPRYSTRTWRDCGLRHLPADVARSKLAAMVERTATVRRTLPSEHPMTSSEPTVEQGV